MMSVGVGGYMEQWFGMSSTDAKGKGGAAMEVNDGSAQQSDSEIHFKGKLEADNGMTPSAASSARSRLEPKTVLPS